MNVCNQKCRGYSTRCSSLEDHGFLSRTLQRAIASATEGMTSDELWDVP